MERLKQKVSEILESTYKDPQIFGIIAVIVNIAIISSVYNYNPYEVADNYPIYTFLVMLLILLFTLMTFFFIRVNKEIERGASPSFFMYKKLPLFEQYKEYIKENGYLLIYLIASVLAIYFLSIFLKNNDLTVDTFQTIFVQVVNIMMVLGAISVIYIILRDGASETDKNETRISR